MVIACNDDERTRALLPRVERRVVTYGLRKDSDFLVSDCRVDGAASHFRVSYRSNDLGEFSVHVPGQHNVLNATAAIAVGVGLDIAPDAIRQALKDFRGVDRRFQLKGSANGIDVIDDYGHHPTEIRATLAAARQCGYKRVHVVFQPHRYTRTQLLIDEFATAFVGADTVSILDIYPASEQPILGVTGEWLARRITESSGRKADYISSFADAATVIAREAKGGEMVLTLGAGNVAQLGQQILEELELKTQSTDATKPQRARTI
jgi:UDP-N-acetylmuramate--alanine ligase